jgi:Cu/Ag efflux protein CusF
MRPKSDYLAVRSGRTMKSLKRRRIEMFKRVVFSAVLAAVLAWPAVGQEMAQSKARRVSEASSSTVTATVEAIDTAKRELTLKGPEGNVVVMEVPESVKRFSEIKVGDQLTVKYTEALLVDVHKADASAKLGMTTEAGLEKTPGAKPAGVLTRTSTATVEVASVDAKAPSITVREADGNTVSFRVRDPKKLDGVNPGDKLVVTYKEAVAVSVTAPPAK